MALANQFGTSNAFNYILETHLEQKSSIGDRFGTPPKKRPIWNNLFQIRDQFGIKKAKYFIETILDKKWFLETILELTQFIIGLA